MSGILFFIFASCHPLTLGQISKSTLFSQLEHRDGIDVEYDQLLSADVIVKKQIPLTKQQKSPYFKQPKPQPPKSRPHHGPHHPKSPRPKPPHLPKPSPLDGSGDEGSGSVSDDNISNDFVESILKLEAPEISDVFTPEIISYAHQIIEEGTEGPEKGITLPKDDTNSQISRSSADHRPVPSPSSDANSLVESEQDVTPIILENIKDTLQTFAENSSNSPDDAYALERKNEATHLKPHPLSTEGFEVDEVDQNKQLSGKLKMTKNRIQLMVDLTELLEIMIKEAD